ncbi:hypothetical protein ABPG72_002691 [Tetrahymena utriculariae]
MEDFNYYARLIKDYSTRDNIERKKEGRYSSKNTYKYDSDIKSTKSFRTGMKTRKFAEKKGLHFLRIRFWNYLPKINPLGQFRIIWDIFVGTSTLYLFFAISVSLSFGIFIDLNTGFYQQGILIKNRKTAALNYLKQYFIFDFVSTASLVGQLFCNDFQYFIILFFLKAKYFTKISKILKEVLHIKPIFRDIESFFKVICVIIFAAHFFACMYISMANYFEITNNWVSKQGLDIRTQQYSVYIRAFYYSTVTMLTVGYGDVTPVNNAEYSIVICTILIGCIFFGYSLNKIGTIFSEMEEQEKKIIKNLFIVNQYMARKDIQKDLQFQVREYLTYYWSQNNSTENKVLEHIIGSLSEGLKQKLQIQATRKVLNQCPIFRQNFTDEFLQKASTLIKEYRCYPDEIITYQGDVDDSSIFFVEQGSVIMYFQGQTNNQGKNDTSAEFRELNKGDTFGFFSFFTGQPRQLSIKSAGFTSLLYIERSPFIKLIKQYQQDYEIFCTICDNLFTGYLYQQVHSDCYCCQYNDHLITDCPKIHLVVDKIELSQRDMKQIRAADFIRKRKKQRPLMNENAANYFIQNQLFYIQAYHQLFISQFDSWFESLEDDDDDDEDEEVDDNHCQESNDRISLLQDLQKKNDHQLSISDESSIKKRHNQENKISLVPLDQGKQAIKSLIYIPDQKTKDITEKITTQLQNNNNNNNKQSTLFINQNKKSRTSSLTKIKNPSISQTDDQNSNALHLQKQNSNQLENSIKQNPSIFTDQLTSMHINIYTNDQQDLSLNSFLQPFKHKKKSLESISISDMDKIQSMINQQSNLFQQSTSQKQASTTQLGGISNANSNAQNQQQQLQFTRQQSIHKQQQQMLQLFQLQQQSINQQMQQILQILQNNLQQSNGSAGQNVVGNNINLQQNILKRRVSNNNQISAQNNLNINLPFNPVQSQQLQQQPDLYSNYGKSQTNTTNELLKQATQQSRNKQISQNQNQQMEQGDKMMLLQKLNNNQVDDAYEDDCKMKIFIYYFPDWNADSILQQINLDNGLSINSSEIIQQNRRNTLSTRRNGAKNKDQTIANKRITQVAYQNANERKVQDVLINLNYVGKQCIEESITREEGSLNFPAIPAIIRNQRKGNTVLIPTIQEQNQQLAALKFTHQSINDKFIVFRKQNNSQTEQKQIYQTTELLSDHAQKLKQMKRKSISVDVDAKQWKKVDNQVLLSQFNNLSKQQSEQKNFLSSKQGSKQNIDFSENIFENIEDSKIPISQNIEINSSNCWASYINKKW